MPVSSLWSPTGWGGWFKYIRRTRCKCNVAILTSKRKFSAVSWTITVFTIFRLLTDFVCLFTYEFWLSLCKIVRSSVILLLPLFIKYINYWNVQYHVRLTVITFINLMLIDWKTNKCKSLLGQDNKRVYRG
jgi:hypothetical protein